MARMENAGELDAARLLDLAFDAIFAIQAGSRRITYWNAAAERTYGYSRQEAVGQVASELLKTRLSGSRDSAYKQVVESGRWEGRLVHTRKDGSEVTVDGRWAFDPATGTILGVNREVTDHVALAERYQLLVESVKDYAILLLDAEGRITSWSEGARRISGASRDTAPRRSSASTSLSSTRLRPSLPASRPKSCVPPPRPDASRTRAGACARTVRSSGPAWSSRHCEIRQAS